MTNITLQLDNLTCPSCMNKIITTINGLHGVEKIKILFDAGKARVAFDDDIVSEDDIIHTIENIGYPANRIK